jgi:hypothetical protein
MSRRKVPLPNGCLQKLLGSNKELKGDEEKIKCRLKELNTAENTIVRSLRGTIQLETIQRTANY